MTRKSNPWSGAMAVAALSLAVGGAGCDAGGPDGTPPDSARHRALRAVRAEARSAAEGGSDVSGSRTAIEASWDRVLAAQLAVHVAAEHEEQPRSMVMHIHSDEPEMLAQQVDLMLRLPPTVRLRLVVSSRDAERALRRVLTAGPNPSLLERADLMVVPPGSFSSVWARDFAVGDEVCQVVPLFLRPGLANLRLGPGNPLNEVVDLLADRGTRIVRAPLYFAGGNVVVGRLRDGRRVLLCGSNDFLLSRDAYQAAGLHLTESMFVAVMRAVFDVAEVVVLRPRGTDGKLRSQAVALFHLDQAMLFHRDGEVLVHQVVPLPNEIGADDPWRREVEAVAADLESYATALARLGFTVTRMPLSAERVALRQYYLNSVQIPAEPRSLLIVPSFAHTTDSGAREDDEAAAFLEAQGFRVTMVRDVAHLGQGSNHCLVRRG